LYYNKPFWGLLASTVLISVFFTWIYNNTSRSIATMILFHAMFNFSHYLFPALASDRAGLFLFAIRLAAVALVVVFWGPRRLVR